MFLKLSNLKYTHVVFYRLTDPLRIINFNRTANYIMTEPKIPLE